MATKEMNMIIKIIGLVGAIFVLIAQFVPWGSGAFLFGASNGGFDAFYITFMGQSYWQYAILFGAIMIILFIINLIVLILAFLQFKNFAVKGTRKYLTLGIIATVEFILYTIALNATFGTFAGGIGYSIGFIMILLAMIMFYVTYGLGRTLGITAATGMYQPPAYQEPQPQMMYTSQPPPAQQIPPQQPPQPPQQPQTQPQVEPEKKQPSQKITKAKAAPKFCPECGAPLQTNAKFCASCGHKI